jgi:hypothetical protein
MKPEIEVILPFEMAKIYWRHMRSGAVREISGMLKNVRIEEAKKYWNEVLIILKMQMVGKGKAH